MNPKGRLAKECCTWFSPRTPRQVCGDLPKLRSVCRVPTGLEYRDPTEWHRGFGLSLYCWHLDGAPETRETVKAARNSSSGYIWRTCAEFWLDAFIMNRFLTCKTASIFFLSTSETQVMLERAFTPRMSPEILRHPYWVAERVYTCRNIHQTCCVPNFPGLEWTWIHPNVEKVRLVWSVFSI